MRLIPTRIAMPNQIGIHGNFSVGSFLIQNHRAVATAIMLALWALAVPKLVIIGTRRLNVPGSRATVGRKS
jgi:hypothetical protein